MTFSKWLNCIPNNIRKESEHTSDGPADENVRKKCSTFLGVMVLSAKLASVLLVVVIKIKSLKKTTSFHLLKKFLSSIFKIWLKFGTIRKLMRPSIVSKSTADKNKICYRRKEKSQPNIG